MIMFHVSVTALSNAESIHLRKSIFQRENKIFIFFMRISLLFFSVLCSCEENGLLPLAGGEKTLIPDPKSFENSGGEIRAEFGKIPESLLKYFSTDAFLQYRTLL